MATYRIQGPDGQTYQVTAPDDASQDAILAYVRNQAAAPGAPSSTARQSPPVSGAPGSGPTYQEPPNPIESLGHGFQNVKSGLQNLYYMATGQDDKLKGLTDQTNADNALYEQGRAKGQANADALTGPISTARAIASQMLPFGADLEAQRHVAAGGGPDVMSGVGKTLPLAPLAALGVPASVAGRIAMGTGLGAAQGAAEFDPTGTLEGKAKQIGAGAVAGTALQGGGELVAAVAPKVVQAFRAVRARAGGVDPAAVQTDLAQGLKDAGLDWNALDGTRQAQITASAVQALKAGRELDPAALLRKADFDALGAPYTLGQVTRDARQWTAEQRVRKLEGVGDPLQQTLEAQNQNLAGQLPALRTATGAKAGSGYEAAENARTAVQDFAQQSQGDVRKLYQTARDAGDKDTILPHDPFAQALSDITENFGIENVKPAIVSRAKEFGLLGGDVRRRWLTIDEAERFRKLIGNNTDWKDATSAAVGKQLQGALDDAVGAVGTDAGQAFTQARAAAKERFAALEPTPVKALNQTNEAPVNFVETKVLGGKPGELDALRSVVQKQNPAAWDDVRGSVVDWLMQKAQNRGTFNGGAFKDALDRIGMARLKVIFTPEELAQLGTISRAGFNATVPPPLAAVNYSNTGSELANLLANKDTGPGLIGSIVGHLPIVGRAAVGAYQMGRQAMGASALRSAAQEAAAPSVASLSPRPQTDRRALAALLLRFGTAAGDAGQPNRAP